MTLIKKYWLEILTLGVILAIMLVCCAPSSTWINTDSDGIHDVYAAKYLYLAHHTSMPLYLLVGNLFVRMPFGTDFWNLALLSVLSTVGACIFIYLSIREHLKDNKRASIYGVLGMLVYGGSALVISQSTIVESYATVTMLGAGAYYFYLKKWWKRCALMLGLGMSVHLLAGIPLIVLLIFERELRRWRPLVIIGACLLLYLYIPLSPIIFPEQPNMWGNKTVKDAILDLYGTYNTLFGSLAIFDLPKRLLDTIGLLLASLGISLIFIVKLFWGEPKKRNVLLWLFLLPIIMFIIGLPPQTYVYLMPSIAVGAIVTMIALSRLHSRWTLVVIGVTVGMMLFNMIYFDIGTTLDPEMSATKYYTEELDKVPDGHILMPYYGWEWAAIFSYNKENDRNIIPVCLDIVRSPIYRGQLESQGINIEDSDAADLWQQRNEIGLSIVALNDNVWTTKTTDASTYGCEVVIARGNEHLVARVPNEPAGKMHWIPSNPYDIITGRIEIKEWKFITMSNWNVRLFGGLAAIAMIINWLVWLPQRRAKKNEGVSKSGIEGAKETPLSQ